jgi:hypothetical protein
MLRRSHTHTKEQYSVEEQSIHAWTVEHDVTKEDVELLLQHGYLKYNTLQCSQHNTQYSLCKRSKTKDGWELRCSKCKSHSSKSIRINSIFENRKYSIPQLITVVRLMQNKADWNTMITESHLSKNTIDSIFEQLVDRMKPELEKYLYENDVIFNNKSQLQIDEAKMNWEGDTMKYNFSEKVEQEHGQWVIGMVDILTKKVYFECCPNRSNESLIETIADVVEPGATITTDALSTYECLSTNYTHLTINKSQDGFCSCTNNANTHIHVNNIECQWCNLRRLGRKKSITHPQHVPHLVLEYMYRTYNGCFFELLK